MKNERKKKRTKSIVSSLSVWESHAHHAIIHCVESICVVFSLLRCFSGSVSHFRTTLYSLRNAVSYCYNDLSLTNFAPFQFHHTLSFHFHGQDFSFILYHFVIITSAKLRIDLKRSYSRKARDTELSLCSETLVRWMDKKEGLKREGEREKKRPLFL